MKPLIPSLAHLFRVTADTLRRFPVSSLAALLATVCFIVLIAQEAQGPHPLGRAALAALYSFVLQNGLSLSLLSLRMLFGVEVDPKMYAYMGKILFQ